MGDVAGKIKKRIREAGGNLIGNIVLTDKSPNLVSVLTIVKWMTTGVKHGNGMYTKFFPPAGVDQKEIEASGKFGEVILRTFKENALNELQDQLLTEDAVKINPVLASIEKRGFMMFKIWSKFILKKGAYNHPERIGRLKLFKYYLFAVIFLISPIVSLLFNIIHKINAGGTKRMIAYYAHNNLHE